MLNQTIAEHPANQITIFFHCQGVMAGPASFSNKINRQALNCLHKREEMLNKQDKKIEEGR
jgi:hypothetical protein